MKLKEHYFARFFRKHSERLPGCRPRRKPVRRSNPFLFEPLEPRILLSADLMPVLTDPTELTLVLENDTFQLVDSLGQEVQAEARDADNRVVVTGRDGVEDTLTIDDSIIQAGSIVVFNAGTGTDTLIVSSDSAFQLTDTSLSINGFDQVTLSSVEEAQLTGGSSDNILDALGFTGTTTLSGLGGKDSLTGGSGPDTLLGGAGDDTYVFRGDWGDDAVVEAAGGGFDTLDFTGHSLALTINADRSEITSGPNRVAQSTVMAEQAEAVDVALSANAQRALIDDGLAHLVTRAEDLEDTKDFDKAVALLRQDQVDGEGNDNAQPVSLGDALDLFRRVLQSSTGGRRLF